ncbi:seryl-tRNA synthetase [Saccharicrinis carchari]|uniref:Serine--tRNA ligase n=1 Tax=Saccharicrinis carchari TaxID=1168039 RepID=A0A521EK47_SACCC|nr:serine--tRNA ligase [Saccharicrinis carchari]SMO84299.1 seryl-tRNA synthetase [Saccharicrinis carchari]
MLTLKFIQENKDEVIERLKVKRFDAAQIVRDIIELDDKRKATQSAADAKQAEMNSLSKEIGMLFKQGKIQEANQAKAQTAELKETIRELNDVLNKTTLALDGELVKLPNIPHSSVTPGNSDADNVMVKEGGALKPIQGAKLPHWELVKKYDIIDFELGTKITGAGFPVYKGKGAKLQRALISFFLDEGEKAGYNEVLPPIVVNEDSGFGTGQLPDKEGMMYHAAADNLYLIPTAEVPVTNMYRNEVLKEEELPIKNMAYTPCFRREAGSWGAHVRGLNRLHQFDKVEIVHISHPDTSYQALDDMVAHVEGLINKLGLPYRIMRLCGGDISFTSALTFDFEVYSAAQDRWLEVSSVSNFEAYQANRLKCRYKGKDMKKAELVHTLNGSALALPRIVAALLENNQTAEGIKIPEVLVPYCNFDTIN